jgi:replication factor C subunit 2/4
MKERLTTICQAEKCPLQEAQLDTILELAEGDMRRAVQTLQSVNALAIGHSGNNKTNNIVLDDAAIAELVGLPPAKVVDDLVQALVDSQGIFDKVQTAVEEVCMAGYSAQTLMGCLLQRFVELPQLDDMGRAKLAIRIAEAEHCMLDGADEYLQLMTVCGLAMQCLKSSASNNNMATN